VKFIENVLLFLIVAACLTLIAIVGSSGWPFYVTAPIILTAVAVAWYVIRLSYKAQNGE